jgi:rod shape-determining protein MreC
MFAKKNFSRVSFTILLTVSILMIVADYHQLYLKRLRSWLSLTVVPIQVAVNWPVTFIGWIESSVASRQALIDENIRLRYQQMMLAAQLQKLVVIKKENSQLKQLLRTSNRDESKVIAAQILAVDTHNYKHLIIIDKGKKHGLYQGQPVLDATGVMGQVIDVSLYISTILLITDHKSAVPVRINRTGERAILIGTDDMNELSLIHLPKTSSVKVGDNLVTSGLARRYPEGYPVGIVSSVKLNPGDAFIDIKVRPSAKLNQSRLVLVVWPGEYEKQLTEQLVKHSEKVIVG